MVPLATDKYSAHLARYQLKEEEERRQAPPPMVWLNRETHVLYYTA